MKKIITTMLIIAACITATNAQEVWTWAKGGGGNTTDAGYGVATNLTGNIYVTGVFLSDTIIIGSDTLINKGNNDVFLAKYDNEGNVLWAKSFGGKDDDYGMSVSTDDFSNVYVTGYFKDTVFCNTDTLVSAGDFDVFLVKYNSTGNPLWSVKGGGSNIDKGTAISVDASGYVYITGRFNSSTAAFGTEVITNTSGGTDDILVVKYTPTGNVIWARNTGGTTEDKSYDIAADIFGNVYVTGWFYSNTMTFGTTTLNNNGFIDFYILKYDSAGNALWARSAGGSDEDEGFGITTDSAGNVYVTGNFESSSITFGSITLTNHGVGQRDMLLVKYDSTGNVIWAKNAGGALQDRGEGVIVDVSGNVVVAGWFHSTDMVFASDTLLHYTDRDIFVAKYDTSGNELWAKSAGGSIQEVSNTIATDLSGNIYVGGYYDSPDITFGTNIFGTNGNRDFYIAKIAECSVVITLNDSVFICEGDSVELDAGTGNGYTYLWSTGDTIQTIYIDTSGTYWVQVTDANTCVNADTIIAILNLLPVVDLGQDSTFCADDSLILDVGAGYIYLWSTADTTQTIVVDTTSTYRVQITDSNNCMNYDTIEIIVNPIPLVDLGPDTMTCCNEPMVLTANGGISYQWSTGDTTVSIIDTVRSTTTYIVTVTNSYGCTNTDSVTVIITPVNIYLGPDTTICAGTSITLVPMNDCYGSSLPSWFTYLWSDGSTNSILTVDSTGVGFDSVMITLTIDDSICGLHDVDTVIVIFQNCTGINDFTDNSDINIFPNPSTGTFTISITGINDVVELTVINLQGQEVYTEKLNVTGNYTKQIALSAYPKGIYFLKLMGGDVVRTEKVVVY